MLRRRRFDHDADRGHAFLHGLVGEAVVEHLVELGDDGCAACRAGANTPYQVVTS